MSSVYSPTQDTSGFLQLLFEMSDSVKMRGNPHSNLTDKKDTEVSVHVATKCKFIWKEALKPQRNHRADSYRTVLNVPACLLPVTGRVARRWRFLCTALISSCKSFHNSSRLLSEQTAGNYHRIVCPGETAEQSSICFMVPTSTCG